MVYGAKEVMTISPDHLVYPTGSHAVGKTEMCEHLVENYGFGVIETGTMVRELYANRESPHTDLGLGQYVKAVESAEPGYFDKQLAARIDDLGNGLVIVNGMRSLTNIERARSAYPDSRHSIIWMQASFERLHQRYMEREHKPLTPQEFDDLLSADKALGLDAIEDRADFVIINDSTVEALHERADDIMRGLGIAAVTGHHSE